MTPVMSKASGIDKTCPACGALFYVQAYRAEQAKFCSMKCMWAGRQKRVRKTIQCVCRKCEKPYVVDAHRKSKTGFCSKNCSTKFNAPKRKIARARAEWSDPGHKICIKCGIQKQLAEFWKRPGNYDGYRGRCISCSKEVDSRWRDENVDRKRSYDRKYNIDNAEEISKKSQAKYEANRTEILAKNKKWREDNPGKVNAQNRNKRALHGEKLRSGRRQHYRENSASYKAAAVARKEHIRIATPPWADLKKIAAIYADAERLTKETGITHHVDHFYPLRGKTMCGLHVEGNLQIVHAIVNLKKSNRVGESDGHPAPPGAMYLPGENSV